MINHTASCGYSCNSPVQPEITTLLGPIVPKSKPLAAIVVAESGIPLAPLALSAIGIETVKEPPIGTAATLVKAIVQVPDCVAITQPEVSTAVVRGVFRLK